MQRPEPRHAQRLLWIPEPSGSLNPKHQMHAGRERLPSFTPVPLRLEALLAEGRRLAQEQEHVNSFRLSEEYMRSTGTQQSSLIGLSG